jgi:hypothetical protein
MGKCEVEFERMLRRCRIGYGLDYNNVKTTSSIFFSQEDEAYQDFRFYPHFPALSPSGLCITHK